MPRVRIESAFHDFYKALAADDEIGTGRKTFGTMKDVFMLAFAFGAAKPLRTPLAKSTDIFADTVLRPNDWDVIKAVVLAEGESQLELMGNDEELINAAQEYANTGVRILKAEYLPSAPEESLASALLEACATAKAGR